MQITTKNNDNVSRFIDLIYQGVNAWVEAGKIASKCLDEDPDFAEKVHEKSPEISTDMIYAFDRIGRNELHPRLLLSNAPGVRRLRRLPYRLQEKYLSEPIEMLTKSGEKWDTLKVAVNNLTPSQAQQCFDENGIRSIPAQRTWIESKAAVTSVQFDEPYRVSGRKLIIMEPCQLNAKQLAQLLAQME